MVLVSFIVMFAVFHFGTRSWGSLKTIEGQECFPYTYWLMEKGKKPVQGDSVVFKSRIIPNFPDQTSFVKKIAGAPGDMVVVETLDQDNRSEEMVEVNGMHMPLKVQGHVYLYSSKGGLIARQTVFEKDTKGRPLPMIETQTIPEGKYYVTGEARRSYDSRYWGLLDESQITGKAHPIY